MNFLNPMALVWGALAIPIVGFYILKIRLRRVPVSTILFWQQIFEQKQPRSIWQHLRHLLSLLVQLALLALLIFALAEPFFRWDAQGARRIVLIVDNSASMNAEDVKPSRLARAKDEAKRAVDSLRFTDEMAILSAGTEPQVASGLTDHQSTLREAIDKISATDGPTRVKESIDLARRLLAGQKNPKILVVTDGGFEEAAELAKDPMVQVVSVGGKADNVGITRFQVRRSLVDPIGYEILAEVVNASDKPAACRIEIDLNDDTVDVVPLKLTPGQKWSQTFEKTSADGGRLVAKLNQPDKSEPLIDGLPADNQAVALLPHRQPQNVTLTKGNHFLRKVFEAIPLVNLTLATAPPATSQLPAGGIAVYAKETPDKFPPGAVLVIDPQKASDYWTIGEKLSSPVVAKQDRDSPFMAHVRLDNVSFPEARQVVPKGPAQVLAQTAGGDPLYLVFNRPEGRLVVLTVDLDQSDLPFQTAFPILMTNAMAEFAGSKGELKESVASGGVAEVDLSAAATNSPELVLVAPDGKTTRPLPKGQSKVSVGPLDRVGVWTIGRRSPSAKVGEAPSITTEAEVACNLASRRESDLRAPTDWKPAAASLASGFGGRPVWYYLIATAWMLAGLEWFLYQRRWIS